MPLLFVHGMPPGVSETQLLRLRITLVSIIAHYMSTPEQEVPKNWVRVFFVPDMLPQPQEEDEGATTVYVRLETAMFSDYDDEATLPIVLASKIADPIWTTLMGEYEVEVCVGQLHPKWKKLLAAAE